MKIIQHEKRIAVIGAGIAGHGIFLYDASNRIGGRIKEYQFDHITVDLGGQLLPQFNDTPNSLTKIIQEACQRYGIKEQSWFG